MGWENRKGSVVITLLEDCIAGRGGGVGVGEEKGPAMGVDCKEGSDVRGGGAHRLRRRVYIYFIVYQFL